MGRLDRSLLTVEAMGVSGVVSLLVEGGLFIVLIANMRDAWCTADIA